MLCNENMMNKKEQLIKTATDLFAQHGFHAVGIDRILAESGVAKMTLYKYFAGKTDLIAAVLLARDQMFRESLTTYVAQRDSPIEKIHAVFIWHEQWFRRKDFHGCMFINASAEFHARTDVVHKHAAAHKRQIIAFLRKLFEAVRPSEAADLALQASLLLDGAIVAAHVNGDMNAAMEAWAVIRRLIDIGENVVAAPGRTRKPGRDRLPASRRPSAENKPVEQ